MTVNTRPPNPDADRLAVRVRGDRGSVSVAFAAAMGLVLLVFAFVTSTHGINDALSRADSLAAEAARAALTAVDTRQPTITIDLTGAVTAAQAYLARAGCPGTVTVTGPRTVAVSVTVDRPAVMGLFGPTYHATATKTATLSTGTQTTTTTGTGNG